MQRVNVTVAAYGCLTGGEALGQKLATVGAFTPIRRRRSEESIFADAFERDEARKNCRLSTVLRHIGRRVSPIAAQIASRRPQQRFALAD